ncbi:MAG: hypothetical protein B6U72_07235 [Candidatus Altiarchaeales archaeon ex4484_2]|nr:MAG: hypothetical protein B6U72_07235 [Candidatus Altiarchaeales archaeon ex4484_2]
MIPCEEPGYEYSSADRLKHPHRYTFSRYMGPGFIRAYIRLRECFLDVLEERLHGHSIPKLERNEAVLYDKGDIDVKKTLYALLSLLESHDVQDSAIKPTLDLLVHKYEVSKRVYLKYCRDNKKPCSDVYDDMEIYGLLSLVCLFFYKRNRNLKYLNCSLKINDMLSSRVDRLGEISAVHLAYSALREELSIISSVLDDEGIVV